MGVESGGAGHHVQVELFDAAVPGAAVEILVVLAQHDTKYRLGM